MDPGINVMLHTHRYQSIGMGYSSLPSDGLLRKVKHGGLIVGLDFYPLTGVTVSDVDFHLVKRGFIEPASCPSLGFCGWVRP